MGSWGMEAAMPRYILEQYEHQRKRRMKFLCEHIQGPALMLGIWLIPSIRPLLLSHRTWQ